MSVIQVSKPEEFVAMFNKLFGFQGYEALLSGDDVSITLPDAKEIEALLRTGDHNGVHFRRLVVRKAIDGFVAGWAGATEGEVGVDLHQFEEYFAK